MKEYLQRLVAHEAWANRLLLDALVKEKTVAKRARDTFAHICSAPEYWLRRVQGEQIKEYEWWPVFDQDALEMIIDRNEFMWSEYLHILPDPVDSFTVETISQRGEQLTFRVADILTQFHTHSAYHRGQIAMLFRAAGIDPINTDYIVWIREQEEM